jgi:hypothetical protein
MARANLNHTLTDSQRADLTEIVSLLAANSRRRGIHGDPLPFLKSCLVSAGFPSAWTQTLASYVATDSLFQSLQDPANGAILGDCMMALLQDAMDTQSDARKQAQAASSTGFQAQVWQIPLHRTILRDTLQRLRSGS